MLCINELLVEHRKNPIGLDEAAPGFSWILESEKKNVRQIAYRLKVKDKNKQLWDSDWIESEQSTGVIYQGIQLQPQTEYTVSITVWDNKGEEAGASASFETGMMGSDSFTGKWITHTMAEKETACPVFVKSFDSTRKILRARLYASACGIYDVKLNGHKVGEDFFAPGWTNYKKFIQYQTYDVTAMIMKKNELEITVAPGWYAGTFGCDGQAHHYGDRIGVFAELHLWYENGSKETIMTDESWNWKTDEVRYSEFYNGEVQDTTWSGEPFKCVEVFSMDHIDLIAQQCEPVQIEKKLKPQQIIHTTKGEVVLDFAQNMAGFIEMIIDGEPGQKITIRHAEVLDREGNFYTENLRSAKATDTFICRGGRQMFRPRFTYHGFRYICVEGLGEEPKLSAFKACVLSTTMEKTSGFHCSNEMVNQLWSNIKWGQDSNFLDIPSDCPQRDERMGWTGDATVFCRTAAHNRNVYLFFKKWLKDLASEQSMEYGVPHVVPNIVGNHGGAAIWSDSAAIVPWTMYEIYGDKRILECQYQSIKDWVDFIQRQETPQHLRQTGHQYGDWLALDTEEGITRPQGGTDPYLIASIFYAHSTRILYQTAEILGYEQDVLQYRKLYEKIRIGIQKEYITETGRLVSETQTACVLMLHFDIARPEHRERISRTLIDNLSAHKGHLTTGFIGTPFLCHTLSEIGRHDLAGKLLLNEEYPGWLNEVKLGATTIWERWNSMNADGTFDESGMNSFNHYAFGAIGDWMVERLAGIQTAEAGYKKIILKPQFIEGVTEVSAKRKTPYGDIVCSWKCKSGKITVEIIIPVNTTALLYLPEKEEVQELGSGTYYFSYNTQTCLEAKRYSMDSTFGELLSNPHAAAIIEKKMPGSTNTLSMEFLKNKSINEIMLMAPDMNKDAYQSAIAELNQMDK